MQHEMALIGCINTQTIDLPTDVVAVCDSEQGAMRLCIARAVPFRKQGDIAELMGISRALLNRMVNADHHKQPRYMSRALQVQLQQICGNRAIDQWADLYAQGMLNCQRTIEDREAELLAELERLKEARENLGEYK